MGLIEQSNAQYYTGSEVFFETSSVSTLTCDLKVPLHDDIQGQKSSNYKIFYDPTGSGQQDNYIEYPKDTENGLTSINQNSVNLSLGWSVTSSSTFIDGTFLVQPVTTNGFGALLSVVVFNGQINIISVVNAGNEYVDQQTITIPANSLGLGSVATSSTLNSTCLYTGVNYTVFYDGQNIINFTNSGLPGPISPYTQIAVKIQLNKSSVWDNYGSYEYVSLDDIVNNFIVGYTGPGKILENINRAQVVFFAKRGLQEFSYDTLRSVKSLELSLSPSASVVIPQDYVNYVSMSWVDGTGVKHPIYPTTLTSSPTQPLIQDSEGQPLQDSYEQNVQAAESNTNINWGKLNASNINGLVTTEDLNANIYNWTWWDSVYGQRYGQEPEVSNMNGWFNIDRRKNTINFSSNLKDKLIVLDYISDGLAYDEDTKIPKMAEQALYMHIVYSLVSMMPGMQEYVIRRYKKEKSSSLRNANIRLSNIKLSEFVQVMRGKSKWIKH